MSDKMADNTGGSDVQLDSDGDLGVSGSGDVPGAESVHAPDGLEPEQEEINDEDRAAMAQFLSQLGARQQSQVFACVGHANHHKLAVIDLVKKLKSRGLTEESPEFGQALGQAMQLGQLAAQGIAIPEGADVIPAMRPADLMVGGTSLCLSCYVPQRQSSLAVAMPGGFKG